jgi:hypothetical protein
MSFLTRGALAPDRKQVCKVDLASGRPRLGDRRREVALDSAVASRLIIPAALFIWILAIVGVAIHAFLNPQKHTVFPIYAAAARDWWARRPLYFQPHPDEFMYGPLFAIAISPLAFLRESVGGMLWKTFNAAVFLGALFTWLRSARRDRFGSGAVAAILLLALGESMQSLYDGNANLTMLAGILLALAALVQGRKIRAGMLLSSVALTKVFPIALVALLAVSSGAAILWPFAIGIGAGVLLPIVVMPSSGVTQTRLWLKLLFARTGERELRYCSIDQLFRAVGHPLPLIWSNALLATAGIIAAILCVTYARRSDRQDSLLFTFGAFCTWAVLFLPTMEPATIAFIAVPIAIAIVEAWRRQTYVWFAALLTAWWLCGPALTDIAGKQARVFAQGHCAMTLGSLLFASYLSAMWKRSLKVEMRELNGPRIPFPGTGQDDVMPYVPAPSHGEISQGVRDFQG